MLSPPKLDFRHEAGRAVFNICYLDKDSRILSANSVELTERRDDVAGNIFILEAPRGKPVSCIFYSILPDLADISVVQKTSGGDIYAAKKLLGEHPHEFLVGGFIRALAGVLDEFPDSTIMLDLMGRHHGYMGFGTNPVYAQLRERFFDRQKWSLNANKVRVQELLGGDNRWIIRNRMTISQGEKETVSPRP